MSISKDSLPYKFIFNAIKGGIFFRLKTNSRNGNYWNPGFAGIPFTPKKDPVHEISYLVHDIMHHLMPDLPYDGSIDLSSRNVYLVSRMMSEAWSLVLADMLFIDELKKAGVQYDWRKRCIYPLYEELRDKGYGLKELLMTVTKFVITGDYDHIPDSEAKNLFVEKYAPFFSADWRWTRANWEALTQRSSSAKKWFEMVGEESFISLGLTPLSLAVKECGVNDHNNIHDVMNLVFEFNFKNLEKFFCSQEDNCSVGNSIRRWVLGQTAIYSRYLPVVNTTAGFKNPMKIVNNPHTTEMDGVIARQIFDNYLEVLLDLKAISPDDFRLFREIYPHYDPFFVSYKEETITVKDASKNAWSN